VDRRDFLRLSALGLTAPVLASCGDDGEPSGQPSASTSCGPDTPLADIGCGAAPDLEVIPAEAEVVVGASRLAIGLRSQVDQSFVSDAEVTLYAGRSPDAKPEITAPAVWLKEGTIATKGLYSSALSFPAAGAWLVAAVAEKDGARLAGGTTLTVTTSSPSPLPGQKAISVPTPTTAKPLYSNPLCSMRPEPCSMHAISLDAALTNNRPTVVTFSAPSFCLTETCGPVVEIVDAIAKATPAIDFIHVEAYVGPTQPPYPLAPPLTAWKFTTEPWTYFLDAKGVVVDRLSGGLGPEDVRARVARLR
jgi:hypothetical protein